LSKSESLPANWNDSTVGDILKIRNGFAFKSSDYLSGTGTALIRQSELVEGKIDSSEAKRVATKFLDELPNFVINKGDLLIGMSGSLGKISSYADESPALQNQRTGLLVIEPCISRSFASFVLKYVEPQIVASGKGIAVQNVSSQQIESCKFPLPPLNEQVRIVEKLEELLSDLDAGVVELKAAQRKLARYRQSLLKAAVEGALTADWRRARAQTGEPEESGADLLQRILTERRTRWESKQLAKFAEQGKTPPKDWKAKYLEPAVTNSTSRCELPSGWVWASIDQLTEFVTSGSRGWADYYADRGSTFIRSQNISRDTLDLSDIAFVNPPKNSEGARTRVQCDDILLTITGANVGKSALVDIHLDEAYVSQHVALIRPIESLLSSYIHLFLTCKAGGRGQLDKDAYGAGKPGLNLQQVLAVIVPLPSSEELPQVLGRVASALDASAAQLAEIDFALKQSAAQRKNILKAAFAGQLVPQDPNDEPASVLLDRIRAERDNPGNSSTRPRRSKAPTRLVEPDA